MGVGGSRELGSVGWGESGESVEGGLWSGLWCWVGVRSCEVRVGGEGGGGMVGGG